MLLNHFVVPYYGNARIENEGKIFPTRLDIAANDIIYVAGGSINGSLSRHVCKLEF